MSLGAYPCDGDEVESVLFLAIRGSFPEAYLYDATTWIRGRATAYDVQVSSKRDHHMIKSLHPRHSGTVLAWICLLMIAGCSSELGSAVFIHPDGSGVAHWGAARLLVDGPDGMLNWDRMDHMGVYRGHQTNSLGSSSNGAATVHAYGVKVPYHSYGMYGDQPLKSLSGNGSLVMEAIDAGLAAGLINSGHIGEPGSGVYAASSPKRSDTDLISRQIIESGADVILSGGERLLIPQGEMGRHGEEGVRKDGLNMIERARELGYKIVYTRDELLALPSATERVLGVFAANHTFNDKPEEALKSEGLPVYEPTAPTVAEMTEVALRILSAKGRRFVLIVEEEGSDNLANSNNASGTLMALARADEAIGVVMDFIREHPKTLLVTSADSDAGGMEVYPIRDEAVFEQPVSATNDNGAPLDGRSGTRTLPFVARPDQFGNRLRFAIGWASGGDALGGVVAKAHGFGSHRLPANVDNTDIYRLMYAVLLGDLPEPHHGGSE